MPHSFIDYKVEIRYFFQKTMLKGIKILDVGPGAATYWNLFQNLGFKMDCVEIYEPYIDKFKLKEKYENVYLSNIMDFNFDSYDCIIMGDILEHLTIKDAQKILNRITKNKQKCLVAVPYTMEQEEYEGNIYETHLQPDLTPENMLERYKQLKFLIGNNKYGYYINKKYEKE